MRRTYRVSIVRDRRYALALLAVISIVAFAGARPARAQSDNFDDSDDAGWTRSSPLGAFGAPGDYSLLSGGYRIQAPASPNPTAVGPARAATFRPNSYSQ